jgi:hypothetical protein
MTVIHRLPDREDHSSAAQHRSDECQVRKRRSGCSSGQSKSLHPPPWSDDGVRGYGRRVRLFDRGDEKRTLDHVLHSVRTGVSGVLVPRREPGVGKSALPLWSTCSSCGDR